MKYISILGSTGSIGIQTLQVIQDLGDNYKVVGLAGKSNVDLIKSQIEQFQPEMVAIGDEKSADILKRHFKGSNIKIEYGREGLIQVATIPKANIVVSAIVGIAGLIPTLEAIKSGKDIALANKETLVTSGSIITDMARKMGVNLLPVDGEHSAIFQCLMGCSDRRNINRLILTASGGPFKDKTTDELKNVTLDDALNHPTWKMGRKITIDSATLMNKGLEVIEAKWLFDIDVSKIDVIIHPQSIVHSMVEFIDGSIVAQLSITDMRLPIQLALTYPDRIKSSLPKLKLSDMPNLSFQEPDIDKFPCLKYAYEAIKLGGTMPTVLNGADEVAVGAFLNGKIKFSDIPLIIKDAMEEYKQKEFKPLTNLALDDIISADRWSRDYVEKRIKS
ncbi:TPA: 1-deoxy-D-xylulose-5-phosphate reductoisomerase [bacterium]|nr:1-deoxy-D-xylulose-5-phosphate reductoisomerase [bacterium]